MPATQLIAVAMRELTSARETLREPEPDLVMTDPESVEAYVKAGRPEGPMGSVYTFHAANVSEIVATGDRVLDLACGPANMLSVVASFNPDAHFTGIDLSEGMLEQARETLDSAGASNVALQHGDITDLSAFGSSTVDAVFSSMALHHLPTTDHLHRVVAEIDRVLKPGGGLYLADFCRLSSASSMDYFAHQHAGRQPQAFTEDYLNSLKAAFSRSDWTEVHRRHLAGRASLYVTPMIHFMTIIKSARRRTGNMGTLRDAIAAHVRSMPDYQRKDLKDLRLFMRLGGLRPELL